MQLATGGAGGDRGATDQQHVTGIQAGIHLHDGDAGFAVTGFDGTLDRRGTAPARQQRGVDVQTAQTRNIEHRLRQDQPVGHHHHDVGLEVAQDLTIGLVLEVERLMDGDIVLERQLLDGARGQLATTPGGAIRLGVDTDDLVATAQQGGQTLGGEIGGAGKGDAQGFRHVL